MWLSLVQQSLTLLRTSRAGESRRASLFVPTWLGAAYACIATGYLSDNSFLWQQRAGELLLEGHVLRYDPFSWVSLPRLWVNHGWLANTFTAALERLGGLGLVRIYAMFLALIFGNAVWRLIATRCDGIGAMLIACFVSYPVWRYWSVRPIFAAYIGIVLLLVVLESSLSIRRQCIVTATLVYLIGSMSPAWTLAVAVIACKCLPLLSTDRRKATLIILATSIGIGLLVVNPWGVDLLKVPFDALGQSKELSLLAEWRRPRLTNALGRFAYLWIAFAFLIGLRKFRSLRPEEMLLFGLGTYLALSAYRGIQIGVLLTIPLVATACPTIPWPRRRYNEPIARLLKVRTATALLGIVAFVSALTMPLLGPSYPRKPLQCLALTNVNTGEPIRVISEDSISGMVIYGAWPHVASFADDRTGHFPLDAYADIRKLQGGASVAKILAKWQATAALIKSDSKWASAMAKQRDWKLVVATANFQLWATGAARQSLAMQCRDAVMPTRALRR